MIWKWNKFESILPRSVLLVYLFYLYLWCPLLPFLLHLRDMYRRCNNHFYIFLNRAFTMILCYRNSHAHHTQTNHLYGNVTHKLGCNHSSSPCTRANTQEHQIKASCVMKVRKDYKKKYVSWSLFRIWRLKHQHSKESNRRKLIMNRDLLCFSMKKGQIYSWTKILIPVVKHKIPHHERKSPANKVFIANDIVIV